AHLPAAAKVIRVEEIEQIQQHVPSRPCWLAFHTPGPEHAVAPLRKAGHSLTAFVHMPLYGRNPHALRPYQVLFAVSRHVAASLQAAAMPGIYPEPLYGVATLEGRGEAGAALRAASPYDWDTRKVRDRVFGLAYWLYEQHRARPAFARLPGVALGIVSRLTPIKQFPLLFGHLAPVLARHPQFRLEIFGAGGYASVRDLRRALAPLRERVRFWGMQTQVGAVYRSIDYLLTGLPEKEALGLNVLEAQACGCPVLAVDAPPFTETVAPEVTGLLYSDPRADRGAGFERLLARLDAAPFRIDEARAPAHLARFSSEAFRARVAAMISWLGARGVLP
ncbi:MAG TPA: glycosyltransferase, partial [Burkholderiales bacterium]|nr:glycosyltransferase [Burkholderiales bacterium]